MARTLYVPYRRNWQCFQNKLDGLNYFDNYGRGGDIQMTEGTIVQYVFPPRRSPKIPVACRGYK